MTQRRSRDVDSLTMTSTFERVFRSRHEVLGAGWKNAPYDRYVAAVLTNVVAAAREFLREDDADPSKPLVRAAQWSLLAIESRRGSPYSNFDELERFALGANVALGEAHSIESVEELFREHVLVPAARVAFEHAEQPASDAIAAEDQLKLLAVSASQIIDRFLIRDEPRQ